VSSLELIVQVIEGTGQGCDPNTNKGEAPSTEGGGEMLGGEGVAGERVEPLIGSPGVYFGDHRIREEGTGGERAFEFRDEQSSEEEGVVRVKSSKISPLVDPQRSKTG